jgi:hypothetical protein
VNQIKAAEAVRGAESMSQDTAPGTVILADPTQVRRPWRTTSRTLFQALVALCVLFPVLVEQTGLKVEDAPWLAIPLAVAAAVARIMALPQVETFLRTFLPFLSAAPSPTKETP